MPISRRGFLKLGAAAGAGALAAPLASGKVKAKGADVENQQNGMGKPIIPVSIPGNYEKIIAPGLAAVYQGITYKD